MRRSFLADDFRTSWPRGTCPSPAITTLPWRRMQRTVVERMRCFIEVTVYRSATAHTARDWGCFRPLARVVTRCSPAAVEETFQKLNALHRPHPFHDFHAVIQHAGIRDLELAAYAAE